MESWTLPAPLGGIFLDIAFIGCCLLAAVVLRRTVPLFQEYLVPASLIAGFIGLAAGPEVLGVVHFPLERMGAYVYHLLALTFICVGLHGGGRRHTWGAVNLGFMQVMSMLLQGILGIGIAYLVMLLLDPDVLPASGMLLPLGFAMGPGIAYSIGRSWEAYGFEQAASIGLALAAIGFLAAYSVGVVLVNRGLRHGSAERQSPDGLTRAERIGIRDADALPEAGRLTFFPGAIEPLAFHLAAVGGLYLLTFWLTDLAARGLVAAGLEAEVPIAWSFHFILANLLALGARRLLRLARADRVFDDGMLHRLTGLMADFLIAASIMAISLSMAWRYALPIALMSVFGVILTYHALRIASERVFERYRFERFAGMFGEMTGTVTSGLALVRILDPEYRSPVAQDLVLSSGMALALGFPLLLVLNLPFTVFEGRPVGTLVVAGLMAAYLAVLLIVWRIFLRRAGADRSES
jgi:ESS family glutamate:Na+ symporter